MSAGELESIFPFEQCQVCNPGCIHAGNLFVVRISMLENDIERIALPTESAHEARVHGIALAIDWYTARTRIMGCILPESDREDNAFSLLTAMIEKTEES